MANERMNTCIAGLALAVSSVTAWFQFAPEPDQIEVISSSLVRSEIPVTISQGGLPLPQSEEETLTLSPVIWQVAIFNPTNHSIPISEIEVIYDHPNGPIFSTSLVHWIKRATGEELALPFVLESQKAESLIFALEIPINNFSHQATECNNSLDSRQDLQNCLFNNGHDLFGNTGVRMGGESSFMWNSSPISPNFRVSLKNSEGELVSARLAYYPVEFSNF